MEGGGTENHQMSAFQGNWIILPKGKLKPRKIKWWAQVHITRKGRCSLSSNFQSPSYYIMWLAYLMCPISKRKVSSPIPHPLNSFYCKQFILKFQEKWLQIFFETLEICKLISWVATLFKHKGMFVILLILYVRCFLNFKKTFFGNLLIYSRIAVASYAVTQR